MSDDKVEDLKKDNNQNKKVTKEAAFKKLMEAKIKAKGAELDKAVEEYLKADDLRTVALEKMNKIEEEVKTLQASKLEL